MCFVLHQLESVNIHGHHSVEETQADIALTFIEGHDGRVPIEGAAVDSRVGQYLPDNRAAVPRIEDGLKRKRLLLLTDLVFLSSLDPFFSEGVSLSVNLHIVHLSHAHLLCL
jgi:hypothetical protein